MQRIIAMKNMYLLTAILLTGCASGASNSGSSTVVGEVRKAIDSSQVMQYLEFPDNFELIGIVTAPGDAGLSEQGSVDHAMEELKKQAAKLGANGIIIVSSSAQNSTITGGYGSGYIYTVSVPEKSVVGKAIYVE